jgi:hypothetical protein
MQFVTDAATCTRCGKTLDYPVLCVCTHSMLLAVDLAEDDAKPFHRDQYKVRRPGEYDRLRYPVAND